MTNVQKFYGLKVLHISDLRTYFFLKKVLSVLSVSFPADKTPAGVKLTPHLI
jgi:hypothetical protein